MKKFNFIIATVVFIFFLPSCSPTYMANLPKNAYMTSAKMDKLNLGMSRAEVIDILGTGYTISERKNDINNNAMEVLSYNNIWNTSEYYFFVFKNNKLDRWYMKIYTSQVMKSDPQ